VLENHDEKRRLETQDALDPQKKLPEKGQITPDLPSGDFFP
jgi:hypothetical protein